MPRAQRNLVLLLRVIGSLAIAAVVPVFMPHSWMDRIHAALGLGTLPETPIIVYLTRSLSAFYATHGGMLWLISGDVRRYAPAIRYSGWALTAFGAVSLWIDLRAGLPWSWVLGESPVVIAMGLGVLELLRRSERDRQGTPGE